MGEALDMYHPVETHLAEKIYDSQKLCLQLTEFALWCMMCWAVPRCVTGFHLEATKTKRTTIRKPGTTLRVSRLNYNIENFPKTYIWSLDAMAYRHIHVKFQPCTTPNHACHLRAPFGIKTYISSLGVMTYRNIHIKFEHCETQTQTGHVLSQCGYQNIHIKFGRHDKRIHVSRESIHKRSWLWGRWLLRGVAFMMACCRWCHTSNIALSTSLV